MKPPVKWKGHEDGRSYLECGFDALGYALIFVIVAGVFFLFAFFGMVWRVFTWPARVMRWLS